VLSSECGQAVATEPGAQGAATMNQRSDWGQDEAEDPWGWEGESQAPEDDEQARQADA
jgi:hypothetical protein